MEKKEVGLKNQVLNSAPKLFFSSVDEENEGKSFNIS